MNIVTATRSACFRQLATFVIGAILLLLAPTAPGGSIFDDDYIPPKRVEPAPLPTTPAPNPVAPAPPIRPDAVSPKPAGVVENVRHAMPDKADRAKCRKLFEEVYTAELKDHSPAGRRKLAQALMTEAGKAAEGSPDRFVLLNGAIQAAEEAGSLRMSFTAAGNLADAYDIDALAIKIAAARKMFAVPKSTALTSLPNVEAFMTLADELVAAEDFATVVQVESALQRAVPGISDAELKTEVTNQVSEMTALCAAREKVAPVLAKLQKSPDDAAANLAVGSYLCLQRGQWDKGLPLLAKFGDPVVKDLAATELAGPADGDAMMKLADGWADYASKLPAPNRSKAMQHVASLYRSAEASVGGLQRLVIEKRLAQFPPATWQRRVDLLDLFDPATSVVHGFWTMQDGSLVAEQAVHGCVEFAYVPPEEYDFKISFTVLHVESAVSHICAVGRHQFIYHLGGFDDTLAAFETVRNVPGRDNETARKKDHWLVNGQHYVSVVKVRRNGAEAYLNGEFVTSVKTNYSDVILPKYWTLPRNNVVGLAAHQSGYRFDSAQIIEITGEGKFLSP